jgi:tetratricopeptide (TPR) repeat protein
VIQVTVARQGTTDTSPWPVELSFLHQRRISFERVWLEQKEQTFDFVLTDRPLGASAWRYRFVEGEPVSETWEPSRTPLAEAHRIYESLVGNTRSLLAADATIATALQAADAIDQQETREPFSAALNAELSELYWLVGKTLYGSSDEEQKAQGLEWLERCLTAIPDEPKMHYWPAYEEMVGFHHGDSVARASVILADVYESDGRNTDAVRVLEAAAEVAPDDRAVQQKLGELRDGQD